MVSQNEGSIMRFLKIFRCFYVGKYPFFAIIFYFCRTIVAICYQKMHKTRDIRTRIDER